MAKTGVIGNAVLRISADTASLQKGLAKAGSAANKAASGMSEKFKKVGRVTSTVGKRMSVFGGIVTGVAGAAITKFSSLGDTLDKMSLRTGVSAQSLGELSHALELSGSNLAEFETSLRRMQRAIGDAGDEWKRAMAAGKEPTGEYTQSLQRLGLQFSDLQKLSPEQQFSLIAARIGAIGDPTEQAAVAMEIFGRSGTAMLPMLKQGASGIAAMREEVSSVNFQQVAEQGAAFTDALHRVKTSAMVLGTTILTDLVPSVIAFLNDSVMPALAGVRAWVSEHRELAGTISKIVVVAGALAVALGPPLIVLGSMISAAGTLMGALSGVAGVVGSVAAVVGIGPLSLLAVIGATFAVFFKFGRWLDNTFSGTIDAIADKIYGAVQWLGKLVGLSKDAGYTTMEEGSDELRRARIREGLMEDNTEDLRADINRAFGVPAMAMGGVSRGGLALVGERGPELVDLPRGARVYSNRESQAMAGGVSVTVNGLTVREEADVHRIAREIGRMVDNRMVARGLRPVTT